MLYILYIGLTAKQVIKILSRRYIERSRNYKRRQKMKYYCDIKKQKENMYIVHFPDMANVTTFGTSIDDAKKMAKEALDAVLETDIEEGFPVPEQKYNEGIEIEVSPKSAFAIELRKARGNRTQKDVAKDAGMTYQQYQRLENPKKTNPTLEMLYRLQKVFNRPFLAL